MAEYVSSSQEVTKRTVELPKSVGISQQYGPAVQIFEVRMHKLPGKIIARLALYGARIVIERGAAMTKAERQKDPTLGDKRADAMRKRILGWEQGEWAERQRAPKRPPIIAEAVDKVKAGLKDKARWKAFAAATVTDQASFEAACERAGIARENVAALLDAAAAVVAARDAAPSIDL